MRRAFFQRKSDDDFLRLICCRNRAKIFREQRNQGAGEALSLVGIHCRRHPAAAGLIRNRRRAEQDAGQGLRLRGSVRKTELSSRLIAACGSPRGDAASQPARSSIQAGRRANAFLIGKHPLSLNRAVSARRSYRRKCRAAPLAYLDSSPLPAERTSEREQAAA